MHYHSPSAKPRPRPKKNNGGGTGIYLLLVISCMVIIGIVFTVALIPAESGMGGPTTNSLLSSISSVKQKTAQSIEDKIKGWMPEAHSMLALMARPARNPVLDYEPNWEEEIWTPIDVVDVSSDPIIVLCKLNLKAHAQDPHLTPMFKDLIGASNCKGNNRRREKLKKLIKEISDNPDSSENRVVPPSGFVFHESRVGSTLVANFMASDPYALVFSESAPMANAILHCESCSREYQVQLFRDVTTLMGRSPFHTHLFFKFQSITVTNMHIALEAFPDTPWAFVFRDPVQTMMSHMDPKKGGGNNAPCMRSKRHPSVEVQRTMQQHAGTSSRAAPSEAWCAAHLNMLCTSALRNYETYKYSATLVDPATNQPRQRAVLINYDALPGYVPQVLLPLFGVNPVPSRWVEKIRSESEFYSKSRGTKLHKFTGDSEDKEERATEAIEKYAEKILQPTYDLLEAKAREAIQAVSPAHATRVVEKDDWSFVSEIPAATNSLESSSSDGAAVRGGPGVNPSSVDPLELPHSTALVEKEYVPWGPFTNHHSSKTFRRSSCPMTPDPDYPAAYSMIDIVNNWNPDSTEIPPFHYDSLCHFDFQNETQLKQSYSYRKQEKPYVMYNIPEVDEVVKKWNNLEYLNKLLGSRKYRTETSDSNHFMYWKHAKGKFLRSDAGKQWKEPTHVINERFEDWLELAVKGQNKSLDERKHEYFRVSSDAGNPWLFKELPFFKPEPSLMIVQPRDQRGIHCRFGMRNVIAEAHFDGSRNAVVELAGLRRWIMTHPNQCENMHMYLNNHPSGRHSAVDWSKPDLQKFPNFAKLMGNEVILRPGDFLFVPTYWIHYIVSINVNIQCNSRSGAFRGYDKYIKACGF